jgi:hypothetical protein
MRRPIGSNIRDDKRDFFWQDLVVTARTCRRNPIETISQLQNILHEQLRVEADRLGRESGFIQRERKLDGHTFVQGLVFGFQANPASTYCELSQGLAMQGKPISPQGLEQRFSKRSADFMQAVLESMVKVVIQGQPIAMPVIERFKGVYIRDSSIIGLPSSLNEIWRGNGNSSGESAALKLQVCLNYSTGQVAGPVLQAGRAHDRTSPFQDEALPVGALRLADLGYFDLDSFVLDNQRGVYWISRLKTGTIVYDAMGSRLDLLAWLQASDEVQRDVPIQMGAKHVLPCRLIVQRVPQEVVEQRRRRLRDYARKKQVPLRAETLALAAWTLVITNVPAESLSLDEILLLLRVRWQVELLFKLWKDQAKVDEWRSQNPWRILTEIYAKLIGLVISQWIFQTTLWSFPNRSLTRAIRVIQKFAPLIACTFDDPPTLLRVLERLRASLPVASRIDCRQSKPGTWQRLLEFERLDGLC